MSLIGHVVSGFSIQFHIFSTYDYCQGRVVYMCDFYGGADLQSRYTRAQKVVTLKRASRVGGDVGFIMSACFSQTEANTFSKAWSNMPMGGVIASGPTFVYG